MRFQSRSGGQSIGFAAFAALAACAGKGVTVPQSAAVLHVMSTAFGQGAAIPDAHGCTGNDTSPPLSFTGVPAGAKSLALVCEDPDAPVRTWVHWVAYGIPPGTTSIAEGAPPGDMLPQGGTQGKNGWGNVGYGGPCPPSGTHRYYFRVYALDTMPALGPGAAGDELMAAMEGHVVGHGELMGTFAKK